MRKSKVYKVKSLPKGLEAESLLVYDRKLVRQPKIAKWVKAFPRKIAVTGGEDLKDLNSFPDFLLKVLKITKDISPRRLTIVALGGGSVGDFSGFTASVFKRGVKLVQIPSTWLAAIDSAHGGKTALNLPPFKNQIGSYYPAESIYLVGDVLKSQPEKLAQQAMSELAKMALIDSARFWQRLVTTSQKGSSDTLWRNIAQAVDAKWKVVKRDPYEEKGIRHVLNLGHTFGHFLEGKFGLSHGDSVAQGLFFALDWSLVRGIISAKEHEKIVRGLNRLGLTVMSPLSAKRSEFLSIVAQDKKSRGKGNVRFVFVKAPGKTSIQTVSLEDMAEQARTLGWIR